MHEGLFDYPWVLILLLLLPVIGWLMFRGRGRRRGTMMYSRTRPLAEVGSSPRTLVAATLPWLRLAALALIIVACARPVSKTVEEAQVEGIDIYVALDLSGSMQAVDVSDAELRAYQNRREEPPNRFEVARDVLTQFVKTRKVDRIGMVVFARDAFLQFPLTLDYNTILTQLAQLELGDIDGSGTAIGNALGRSVAGLKDSDARTRLAIVITDGDRRGGNISPKQAATFASELGIKVFPILVGKEGKTRVPVGRNLLTNQLTYRYQEYPVNPALLEEIAQMTGGRFYRATDRKALEQNLHEILDEFEKSRLQDLSNVSRTELFGPLAGLAIALLVLELALTYLVVRPFP
ncbi:MAG: aerotolerance regulator BatA [Myxococcales bacterium]|nr:aerotolerance regulator BatA [Myxococcales bacterium]